MKILLFGGSFDPPHRGHETLLRAAVKALRPDRTFVVPAFQNPLKDARPTPGPARLAMLRAMVSQLEGVSVDPFELRRGRTYTYELVRHMRRRFPAAEIWFLAGSDTLATLPRWKRCAELFRALYWVIGKRAAAPNGLLDGMKGKMLPGIFPNISATNLRARLLAGENCRSSLKSSVLAVIRREKLYGLALQRELERGLSPERFQHSLAVAGLAAELAELHELGPERAALAGLLHDCGRSMDMAAMARYALRRRLPVPYLRETARVAPLLLHAYVGADLARRRFGVRDAEVLSAIAKHTLGAPRMGPLDRLLYVADFASPDRTFPEAAGVRRLARRDLGAALRRAVAVKMRYVKAEGSWLHPATNALWASVRRGA